MTVHLVNEVTQSSGNDRSRLKLYVYFESKTTSEPTFHRTWKEPTFFTLVTEF